MKKALVSTRFLPDIVFVWSGRYLRVIKSGVIAGKIDPKWIGVMVQKEYYGTLYEYTYNIRTDNFIIVGERVIYEYERLIL